ncbi:MAG: hypothetical protein NC095_03135 [Muribaculum sp.]|nr:hypothetical protein [Muribaculum sp.]
MKKSNRNILLASISLLVIIAMIAITFEFRRQLGWWAFIDCFTLFMTAFTWLMSIAIGYMIPQSGKLLQKIAIVFAILTLLAWLAEFIIYSL